MGKRSKDMGKLKALLELLVSELPLPEVYRAHRLKGSRKPYWDAHIEPDWLLIYLVKDEYLFLDRTGTHADIFQG
jgi:mRNA interferase YafQ